MGYLPDFDNDLFISYRHVSNESRDKWVDEFCERLQAMLTELVGDVTIWRDKQGIRAGDMWRVEIAEALNRAGIMLAIFSRTYLDSDVCRKELDTFLGKLKQNSGTRKSTIIPIWKQPPKPNQSLPQELREIHGHNFFEWEDAPEKSGIDSSSMRSCSFREYSPTEGAGSFSAALSRLAQDLMFILEELRGEEAKQSAGTVFLAMVGPELHNARAELRADLQQRGYRVVPEREYFWNSDGFREEISADLDDAILCVHLVNRNASIEPETPAHMRLQLELAGSAMKQKGKPLPLIWLQRAEGTDPSVKELIDYIQQDLCNEGVEFLEDSLEEFKTLIYSKLPASPSAQASQECVAGGELVVIVEEEDIAATRELNAFLVNDLGVDIKRVPLSGGAARDPSAMEKTLAGCGRCLLFWGARHEEWVNEVLSLSALAPCLGPKSLSIYAAPPVTPEKETFLTRKATVILAKEELEKFVEKEAAP